MASSLNPSPLAQILPDNVSVSERFGQFQAEMFETERKIVAQASPKRQIEFSAGRACARTALQQLGLQPQPILCGTAREPIWPPGIVGSITHCTGYCAAAVTNDPRVLSLGIDAEQNEELPPGVYDLIVLPGEIPPSIGEPAPALGRLIFSIKESIFKAWFPITRRWLDFKNVKISLNPELHSFSASLQMSAPEDIALRMKTAQGRFAIEVGYIFTSFCLMK
jgi:4'-phosphopantetheinyl transferase EntD